MARKDKHTNCGYCVIQYSANSCIEKCRNWGIRNGLPCIQVCLVPTKDEHLPPIMRVTNRLDEYAIPTQTEVLKVVGHLPLRKSGKFA